MILTGKAKEEFGDVCKYDYHEFIKLDEVVQYAHIIEWFDSVGVYISLNYHPIANSFSYYVNYPDRFYSRITTSRQEATKQAIIKVNEIYNEI